jgi:autophagy-related protein 13
MGMAFFALFLSLAFQLTPWLAQFNIELDETDAFRPDLNLWRNTDSFDPKPPPLIIETYLDTRGLSPDQSLVILDENGKRWNVDEATDAAAARAGLNAEPRRGVRGNMVRHEVILERWVVELRYFFPAAFALVRWSKTNRIGKSDGGCIGGLADE